ncbi:hypothetical protein [Azospirillum oleiclasticum]|uniref:hypothetical protein n=1 Tax=Azospirillum oleiclasticum TaxID=2735135 RepID=UPI001FE7315D|nr:hypothetical protein [Azospirillum oleiclasticum]
MPDRRQVGPGEPAQRQGQPETLRPQLNPLSKVQRIAGEGAGSLQQEGQPVRGDARFPRGAGQGVAVAEQRPYRVGGRHGRADLVRRDGGLGL